MSSIELNNINLFYEIKGEHRIKDFVVPNGSIKNKLTDGNLHALKDINLSVKKGDYLGIVGANGAGKSTLLKLIAGIYPPRSGEMRISGDVASLFELVTGFEMEATGWDNIMARGIMLGETPKTMKKKASEIAEFSELGDYLSIPVKYYSSGMFIRLAFSISTSIEPDILLLDEVMASGDAHFLKKAEKRMKNMMNSVDILIFVSHSMDSILNFCNRAIWLENGEIKEDGTPRSVVDHYLNM